MRSILIIDQGAVGAAIALRCAQAGHTVYHYVEDKPQNYAEECGKDLHPNIEKVTEWIPYASKVDLILPMENGSFIEKLDSLKKRGMPVYAPSAEAVKLEIDRSAGMKFLEDHGIKVPEYKAFKNLDQVEKHILENPGPYVIKPAGDCENKALSFVSKSDVEMLQQIKVWKAQKADFENGIILQKFIKGIEMSACLFVGSDGFVGPVSESFEHKKLMADDLGPSTGEMGTVIKYVKESKLADIVLRPLEKSLVKMKAYCSCDVNCIIDEAGEVHPLEFTMRCGFPAINLQLFLHEGDPIEFLIDALNGEDTLETSFETGICVVVAIPDFPYGNYEKEQVVGLPIYGITEENEKHIQPQSMMKTQMLLESDGEAVEGDGFATAGDYVCILVHSGESVKEAQKNVYDIADQIKIPNMILRTDIGNRVIKALPKLQKLGFAMGWDD